MATEALGLMTEDDETQPQSPAPLPVTLQEETKRQVLGEDYLVLRWAVAGLILAIFVSLMGVILLSWNGTTLPDGVIAIGSTAVGALATMLVRPPSPHG